MKINDLHIQSKPKLIFMANDLFNKGRSNKSYTIKLVNDQHNDEQLDQIFSSRANRAVKFEAVYEIEGIDMQGYLLVSRVYRTHAEAVFVSGNGRLWESLSNKKLADYDWSAYDHELTLTNVTSTESTAGDYIYDLCDRGKFINDIIYEEKASRYDPGVGEVTQLASVDITERYPAISIKTIFETVMHQEGFGISWAENIHNSYLDELYLLYTQDNAIRNSKEWEKSAIFEATGTTSYTDSRTGNGVFYIEKKLYFFTEQFDNGDNFTGAHNDNVGSNVYTVPETGTYRFIAPLFFQLVKPSLAAIDSYSFQIRLEKNGTSIYTRTWLAASIVFDGNIAYIEHTIDTMSTEFEKDDTVAVWAEFFGNIEMTGAWTMYMNQQAGSMFYNTVSRYYGAGSTVNLGALMPDMKAMDFFSKVATMLNINTFYRDETRILEAEQGKRMQSISTSISPVEQVEGLTEKVNYWLNFNTDKARPLDNIYIDNDASKEANVSFDFSRTLVSDCVRVFGNTDSEIPILWKDGDPLSWSEVITPPAWQTKGNLRIMKYDGTADGVYTLTYGGSTSSYDSEQTTYPVFIEPDIESFHRYELTIMEGTAIELICIVDIAKLYDQTYFKRPIWIDGYGVYWLQEAELMKGNIYKLKLLK